MMEEADRKLKVLKEMMEKEGDIMRGT